MSASGVCRNRGGEDRFYSPPAMRRYNQQLQQQSKFPSSSTTTSRPNSKSSSVESSEKRIESDDCKSKTTTTTTATTPRVSSNLTNLDRFLEHTTPIVAAQCFSKMTMRGWGARDEDFHPFFILGDLWESFKEWSAYGAGVPLVLNGSDSVVQYYVPYLSGIQLYIDPLKPSVRLRRPGEESDADSSRETSSDGSCEYGAEAGANNVNRSWGQQNSMNATIQNFNRLGLRGNSYMGLSLDQGEISNPPGLLVFEYMEKDPPYSREPLADKILYLASRSPELRTYRSCDLTPASWVSVAWYPIYRIPTGPTLQNLDACFLTFHSLSTPFGIKSTDSPSTVREIHNTGMPFKLSLPIFGLASYKYKVSVWNSSEAYESQKVNSLLRTADNWIQCLQVNHPDYRFFVSQSSFWR